MAARFKEIMKKYGKVAAGVHLSVSTASMASLYIAIKNNVDVESLLLKWLLPGAGAGLEKDAEENPVRNPNQDRDPKSYSDSRYGFAVEEVRAGLDDVEGLKAKAVTEEKKRSRTAELVTSSGGALALSFLLNTALFPIRVPITIALTPPLSRFLARRRIIKM